MESEKSDTFDTFIEELLNRKGPPTFSMEELLKLPEGTPEILYHYTSIESLALILKHQTFRLKPLDKMDDLQESEVRDIKGAGQYCYVSSWISEERESIPMWKMYASLNRGVRISLPPNPFKFYPVMADDAEEEQSEKERRVLFTLLKSGGLENLRGLTAVPLLDMYSKRYLALFSSPDEILINVEYTEEKEKLSPTIICGDRFRESMGRLGRYKNLYWKFQNEWRYRLIILPMQYDNVSYENSEEFLEEVRKIIFNIQHKAVPYYDLDLNDDAFKNMTITLGPTMDESCRTVVESLRDKYNPDAKILNSELTGYICD